MRHAYYKICPFCNSRLDPGETCDCRIMHTTIKAEEMPLHIPAKGRDNVHKSPTSSRFSLYHYRHI